VGRSPGAQISTDQWRCDGNWSSYVSVSFTMLICPIATFKDRIHILTPIGWTRGASILTKKNRTILLFLLFLAVLVRPNPTFKHVFKTRTPVSRSSGAQISTNQWRCDGNWSRYVSGFFAMLICPFAAFKDRIHILTPIGWARGASVLTKKYRTILLFLHSLTMFVCHNATFEHVFKGCTPMGRASSARIRTGSNSLLLFHALLDCLLTTTNCVLKILAPENCSR